MIVAKAIEPYGYPMNSYIKISNLQTHIHAKLQRIPHSKVLYVRTRQVTEMKAMIRTNNRAVADSKVNDRSESDRAVRISNEFTYKDIQPPIPDPRQTLTNPAFKTTERQNATSSGKES